MEKKRRAAFHNLGCKVNSYETEAMQQLLVENGYELVPFEEPADVYIVNTCTVTNIADRKSRQMLHRAKKQNPRAVVVAAGCYVQARGEEALADGTVDILIGNNQKARLPELLKEWFDRRESDGREREQALSEASDRPLPASLTALSDLSRERDYENLGILRAGSHTRAFLKVQDGCDQFCSYCIIPYARGRIRSRQPEEAEAEVQKLATAGYREIVLTGIHLSSYGLDFAGEKRTEEAPFGRGLARLLMRLSRVEGIERIRLGSLEPRIITKEFVKTLQNSDKLCPHFHLSLQSGSDSVLRRMNRRYTTEEYLNKCCLLRESFDKPAITTDVIAGFPGESEEEFAQTLAFVRQARFYEMHVFPYSRRQGTAAGRMPGQLPEAVKKERSRELLALSGQMSAAYRESWVGQEASVLLEEPEGEKTMAGYTREYIRVLYPGGMEMAGKEVYGKITCRNGNYILE